MSELSDKIRSEFKKEDDERDVLSEYPGRHRTLGEYVYMDMMTGNAGTGRIQARSRHREKTFPIIISVHGRSLDVWR